MTPMTASFISLFTSAISLSGEKDKRKHEYLIAELKASNLNHMVDALVTRRIEICAQQCRDILALYDKQQSAYLQEKEKYTDKILDCSDPLKRSELMARANEIDTRLAEVRLEAKMMFNLMGELLIELGGKNNKQIMGFARELAEPLGLPDYISYPLIE